MKQSQEAATRSVERISDSGTNLIRFADLPGVSLLESEKMIAEKFHHDLPDGRVDAVSRSIFGITLAEIKFIPPEWFRDGYDNLEEWNAAPESDEEKNEWEFEYDETPIDLDLESPERIAVYREAIEFEQRLETPDYLNDDYDFMNYAKTFGFDFSDSSGMHPLRVTRLFFRQAMAASRGIMGHIADLNELHTKQWGENLAEEAKRFRRRSS